ncbi:hypothetical protein ONS95_000968 [Cadophora gregata]|uniref:uncharacterized protein n=1 Tax=Cadophora gregata TaxID=51156 RepID=UPI0026DB60A0|nr:uncharacterized protein ONS95_000968 [Cadophora gregata]KAK0102833.1 hypothetical protein ONS96_005465 [Cadophora gregata f. sp. sojae]KAK0129028.1 hypothetical protein ONS95_000968 [Cadophora gregata]
MPKQAISSNKPVLEWLEGVDDPSPPRFRLMVVTEAEKKAFDWLKRMNGDKSKPHVPLVPELLDGDDGLVSRQLHQEITIPFVYEIVVNDQALVFEWVMSSTENDSAGADGYLELPGTTREFPPG